MVSCAPSEFLRTELHKVGRPVTRSKKIMSYKVTAYLFSPYVYFLNSNSNTRINLNSVQSRVKQAIE